MDSLIEGLLAYCSVDTDEALHAPVALDDVATEGLRQLCSQVTAQKAVVSVYALPRVTGDKVQMGELLQNLLAGVSWWEWRPPPWWPGCRVPVWR